MDVDEARWRFGAARVARLATADAKGAPHIVPVTFALDADRVYSVLDAKPKRSRRLKRLANIAANPRVAVLADEYVEDWMRLWWVRAEGAARIVADGPELETARELLAAKYEQYRGATRLIGPAIVVMVERWTGWRARERERT
ncbi:MAG TPA: TIGR03668 family PPOX class F420-dependent oxidoreductase [Candidatus Limnocylindria bacterium]|nr:TIGR03668 family PPOX class F420-dependent oxidoreductase [Candidatus Limnocylindria bacterium]